MKFTWKTKDGEWHKKEIPDTDENGNKNEEVYDFIHFLETDKSVISWR